MNEPDGIPQPDGRGPSAAGLTRRALLGLLAGGAVAACAAPSPELPPASSSPPSPTMTSQSNPRRATQLSAPPLPKTRDWQPGPGEVRPDVKARATRLIEVTGAWTANAGNRSAARARASAAGFDPDLVASLGLLLGPQGAAVIQVRDAQYGGILADSASVLVPSSAVGGQSGGL